MDQLPILYFDVAHAITVHDWVLENSGGRAGFNDLGLLESALGHIQNDDYYPEFGDKLTHLIFSAIKFHAFSDGNKRTSIALGSYLLEINGYDYCIKRFCAEMENVAVWVADNKIDKDLVRDIIESVIMEDEFSEELKLRIAVAVSDDFENWNE